MITCFRLRTMAWLLAAALLAGGVGGGWAGVLRPDPAFALAALGFTLAVALLSWFMWGTVADAATRPLAGGEPERLWRLGLILALGPAGALLHRYLLRRRP